MPPLPYRVARCIVAFIALVLSVSFVSAPAMGDDLEQRYLRIQRRIREQKLRLERAKKKERSFVAQIDAVNRQLDLIQKKIRIQKKRVRRTRQRIAAVKKEIAIFRRKLDRQKAYLRRKLSAVQRYGPDTTGILAVLVSARNFSQMVRNIHYLRKVAEYDYEQIELYRKNLSELDRKKKRLNSLYGRLRSEERALLADEESLKKELEQKKALLASVRRQRNGYRKMLRELTDASNSIKRMLEKKRANTYRLTRFALLKGKLPWPIKGGRVAKRYGSYRDPEFKTPVFRRGIYIRAGEGMIARAIYTGKVVYADWFKGYGKVIIINHGSGYHSVYANLGEIFFKPGEIVKRGQALGKVGTSGTLSSPALYFEIRYKGKPLNPMQWLAKR